MPVFAGAPHADAFPAQSPGNEHGLAVDARNAAAVVRQVDDIDFDDARICGRTAGSSRQDSEGDVVELPMITAKPCALIVDDDPVSLAFLATALERAGCRCLTAGDAATALAVAREQRIDLLLLDRRMPGCDGVELLRALRTEGVETPAVATSAELDASTIHALHAAGFSATLLKPASLAAIGDLLRRVVSLPAEAAASAAPVQRRAQETPLLDDPCALAAIGNDRDALLALRQLFAGELHVLEMQLADDAYGDEAAAERLHRLRASCGFCGAMALADVVSRLQEALRNGEDTRALVAEFKDLVSATRLAIAAPN